MYLLTYAPKKDSNQPARTCILIRVFVESVKTLISQAVLNLRSADISEGTFSFVTTRIFFVTTRIFYIIQMFCERTAKAFIRLRASSWPSLFTFASNDTVIYIYGMAIYS